MVDRGAHVCVCIDAVEIAWICADARWSGCAAAGYTLFSARPVTDSEYGGIVGRMG